MDKKITLISGPRQAGKTTLAKMLQKKSDYLNFDDESSQEIIFDKSWDRKCQHIIFDELHKMKDWKRWLKGVFDTEGISPCLTVSGSSRLETYRKVGDSLAGRYFHYRVHPFDLYELAQVAPSFCPHTSLERLMKYGGFPEPYLMADETFYNKWKKTHLDIILKQDLIDIKMVRDIKSIEILVQLLQKNVGSKVSYRSLAEDLKVSDKTVKSWIEILEDMYVVFKIMPFHKNIARSNSKQSKYYFYDCARVDSKKDVGAKVENIVAATLYKYVHYQQDCLGQDVDLYYLSKKGGEEIDFAITRAGEIDTVIEVKTSETALSPSFKAFQNDLSSQVRKIQLVKNCKREKTYPSGEEVRSLAPWLANLDI